MYTVLYLNKRTKSLMIFVVSSSKTPIQYDNGTQTKAYIDKW